MTRSLASCLALAFVLSACTGSGGKTLEERMAEDPEKALLEKAGYVPKAKPRPPAGLPPPSDAEFKAWDRKDPEGEKHLYKFDKANLKKMLNYFGELGCFREKMMAEGAKAMGAEPGSPTEEQWHQFKQLFIPMVNVWQQRLLANEPRIMEKSKLIGHFLEAHELVMNNYPVAYNDNDKVALETADANWLIVETKINKYLKNITNEEIPKEDLTDPKVKEKHDKFCARGPQPAEEHRQGQGQVRRRRRRRGQEAQHGRRLSHARRAQHAGVAVRDILADRAARTGRPGPIRSPRPRRSCTSCRTT
jgi:hypothetical protein